MTNCADFLYISIVTPNDATNGHAEDFLNQQTLDVKLFALT